MPPESAPRPTPPARRRGPGWRVLVAAVQGGAVLSGAFVVGWVVQSWLKPRPALLSERWREAEKANRTASGPPRPVAARISGEKVASANAGEFSVERLLALEAPLAELERLAAWLKTCTLAEAEKLLPELAKISHVETREEALRLLFARWATDDPAGALAAATALGRAGVVSVGRIWEQWGRQEVDAAAAAAKTDGRWAAARRRIWQGFARQEPLEALARGGEFGPLERSDVYDAFERAAKASPRELMARFPTLPPEVARESFIALGPMIACDPAAAAEALSAFPDPKIRAQLLKEALRMIDFRDATLAEALVEKEPNGAERDQFATAAAAGVVCAGAAGEGLKLFMRVTGREPRDSEIASLFVGMGASPARMNGLLAEVPAGRVRDGILSVALAEWREVGQGPGEAWFANQSPTALPPLALLHAADFVPAEKWGPLLERLETLPPVMRDRAVANFAAKVPDHTPLAEVDPRLQAAVARREMSGLPGPEPAAFDPLAGEVDASRGTAQQYFEALPPALQGELALAHAAQLASQPALAAQVLATFPPAADDPAAAALAEKVAAEWLRSDASAASSWIGTLPAGAVRDAAAVALIEAVAEEDRPAAEQWAATLRDPVARLRAETLLHR